MTTPSVACELRSISHHPHTSRRRSHGSEEEGSEEDSEEAYGEEEGGEEVDREEVCQEASKDWAYRSRQVGARPPEGASEEEAGDSLDVPQKADRALDGAREAEVGEVVTVSWRVE